MISMVHALQSRFKEEACKNSTNTGNAPNTTNALLPHACIPPVTLSPMLKNFCLTLVFFMIALAMRAQKGDSVYLFCYFKGQGDGLHYAFSMDGYRWETMFGDSAVLLPAAGKDKLLRDPCIVKGRDGNYHMVWTVSWNERGIGYAFSYDLLRWSEQRFLPVMEHQTGTRNTWAPEITFDARKKQYLIYWASTVNGRFPLRDTAAESGYNHRIYYTTTRDFKKFKKTKLLYDPGFSVIDASIVPHEKRYLMFLKNETRSPVEKNIRLATAKKMRGPYSAAGPPITGNYWAEGPAVLRINGQWIVYFDKYRDHRYGAVVSSDLLQWTDVSDKVSFPPGVRHGSVFTISKTEFDKMVVK